MFSINITTTSSRLDLCGATVWSLMHQSLSPDRINIWVSDHAYLSDKGITIEPIWVNTLNNLSDIIRIRYTPNTGPYRKLFPILNESRDEDIIVYADDDVIYGVNWLKNLISTYESYEGKFPVASRVRILEKNVFKKNKGYSLSKICFEKKHLTDNFIITGIGGCVISKKHFLEKDLSLNSYINICPITDDLWISKLLKRSSVGVVCCPDALPEIQEILHGNSALNSLNISRPSGSWVKVKTTSFLIKIRSYLGIPTSNNDICIKKIDNYFESN